MSERRLQGAGTLRIIGNKWYGQFRVGGKQIQRVIGPVRGKRSSEGYSRTEAEALLREMVTAAQAEAKRLGATTRRQGGEKTIDDVWQAYLKDRGRKLKEATLTDYRSCMTNHISPFFGSQPIRDIKREDFERFIAKLERAGLKPKTIHNYGTVAKVIFNFAVSHRWIPYNPGQDVTLPQRTDKVGLTFLEIPEVLALLDNAQTGPNQEIDRAVYAVAAFAGLRWGEVLGLRWMDVDFDAHLIRVQANIVRGKLTTPKSHEMRSIPMAPQAAAELEKLDKRGPAHSVFAVSTGNPPSRTKFMERYRKSLKAAGIDEAFRFHDLRHTFGTTLARSPHVTVQEIQAWMGHADLQTTQQYMHYRPRAADAQRIASAFTVED
jgi:integrase